jgi:hypothetical protein
MKQNLRDKAFVAFVCLVGRKNDLCCLGYLLFEKAKSRKSHC